VAPERAVAIPARLNSKELSMNPTTATSSTRTLSFDAPNWIAPEFMPRDQEQSHRLHEPEHMSNSVDPMTGRDIDNRTSHPHVDDGNLTIYFESEETRQAYLDTPLDRPTRKMSGTPSEEYDRGG
jgi:hypothetical protein